MSIKRYEFQEDAIDWLVKTSSASASKQTMVLRAPTGSGKTIILIQYINRFLSEHKNTAFIWLCPGKGDLEEQSRNRMMEFIPTRQTYDLFEALSSGFSKGSTTFINWEKVTKKGNKAITDGERKNLFERILEAHKDGTEFILIIDEEHSNNTSKAKDIIDYFNAKHIVRVSATTISNRDVEYKEIEEQDVIDEGLITSAISVNEGIEEGSVEDDALLLKLADAKRKDIYNAYKEKGVDIRPLVLIQFPNGEPDKIEAVELTLRDMGYTRENKMV
ncbi:MAG: DEAD/DEAH box helicase family protein, partial [Aeriscardovia sp.]|nr:DEAD/DEAH box helicase family protein [Aeriscardovia sp.]